MLALDMEAAAEEPLTSLNTGPDEYEVCLTAFNDNNCSNYICHTVVVEDELLIYVPNSFTPDGDGTNDWFGPRFSIAVANFNLMIFDRWGGVVFETDSPYEPWTGTYKNNGGDVMKDGVYAWKLKVQDINTGLNRELFGHVTLVK